MRKDILEKAKVLIVDDQEANIRLLERLLGLGGYVHLISTTEPREALRLFSHHHPDLILLDLIMPHLDGFAVMEQLAPLIPGDAYLPILVLTADITSEARQRALSMGAKDFVTKPIDAIEVLLRINNLLETRFLYLELESRVRQRTEELENSVEALRRLSARLLQLQDEERRRIARELHDDTAQNLAAIQLTLSRLIATASGLNLAQHKALADALEYVGECAKSIRTLSYLLHPPLLEELGLLPALQTLVGGFSERTGIRVDLEAPEDFGRLPREVELALFRIVQEGLGNVHRHSGSPTARLRLALESNQVRLELEDAGRGMLPDIWSNRGGALLGVGIAGMRERARQLGGQLDISSGDHGTTVTVSLPLSPA
ncbi:MAG: response regulator [Acidobacteria bacterium]|nr:response regulator [Acidobacteriota bacterium]